MDLVLCFIAVMSIGIFITLMDIERFEGVY